MKKFLVAAIIAMVAFGATFAMATESRIETLGNQGLYLQDDTDQFVNPATAAHYPKMLRLHMGGDMGGDMYAYGGANLSLNDALTLGIYVARNPAFEEGGIAAILGDATSMSIDIDGDTVPDHMGFNPLWMLVSGETIPSMDGNGALVEWKNPFEAILAYKAGDLALGISYYNANERLVYEDSLNGADFNYTAKSGLHALKLGMSMKMSNMMPELWFGYDKFAVRSEADDGNADATWNEDLEGSQITLGGRLFYNMNDNLAIVPAFALEMTNGELTVDADPDLGVSTSNEEDFGLDYKVTTWELGASVQYKADRLFVVSSLGIRSSTMERNETMDDANEFDLTETSKSFSAPVAALGLEYQATKILTIRGGINTTTIWSNQKGIDEGEDAAGDFVDEEMVESFQATDASIGCALTFGNLVIDGTFGNLVLTNENGGGEGNYFSALDMKYIF